MSKSRHLFKGLQMPLEFAGIKGRFLLYAAIAVGIGLIGGFMLMAISQFLGFGAMVGAVLITYIIIQLSQRRGLHPKKQDKGLFRIHTIYTH